MTDRHAGGTLGQRVLNLTQYAKAARNNRIQRQMCAEQCSGHSRQCVTGLPNANYCICGLGRPKLR
ncbi:hypothetical protein [Paenibacillus sp. FSL R5-0928]|uniref:hypothetical protein n=1 Tax=unclassified Paenibacillus TaxID=185978 RepID=UPI0030DD2F59